MRRLSKKSDTTERRADKENATPEILSRPLYCPPLPAFIFLEETGQSRRSLALASLISDCTDDPTYSRIVDGDLTERNQCRGIDPAFLFRMTGSRVLSDL